MPYTFIKKSGGWTEIKSIFVKKSTGWAEVKNVFLKRASGWVKVFTKASLPDTVTAPSIRTTNTSGVGDQYDGPLAVSPRFLNDNLFGKDGVYTNFTSKFGRKFTRADAAAALPSERSTVVTGDLFTSAGGVTTADRSALDGKFLFFELTVQNGSAANEIQSVSSPVKMIKRAPTTTDFQWTGVEQVGTELVLNYVYENYYYNSIDPNLSYIKWWRNTTDVPGGTLIKTETIAATTTGTPNSTSRSGTSRYTPTSADLGFYIVAETTAVNSNTIHFGYTDNYSVTSFPTGVIGSALTFSNVEVQDYLGRKGLDNRDRWPVGTLNRYAWVLNGYDANTTIRVRYRMYNFDNGRYYKPSTGAIQADTAAGANAAYDSWNSDGSGNGYISSISVNGTVATCYDFFDLDSTFFNGGGAGPTWWVEVELSATRGLGRVYEMGYAGPNIFYTGKAITSSISASPSSAQANTNITISGSFLGTPPTPSENAYPRQYRVNYGDNTNSGWLPVNEYPSGTLNPSYSLTKQYSTPGTYNVSIDTIPYYSIYNTSVTINPALSPPTPTGVIWNGTSFVISYTGGSGPWFQSWYRVDNTTYPVDGTGFDSGSATQNTSTITYTPGFTPTPGSIYYFWVRSALTATSNSAGVNVSSYSTTRVQVAIPQVATAPTSVTAANNNSSTTLTVSWSGATNAAFYRIYWNTSGTTPSSASGVFDEEKAVNGSTITSTSGSWAWGPGDPDKNGATPTLGTAYWFFVSSSADGNTWSSWTRTSAAVSTIIPAPVQNSSPTARATSTFSTTLVRYPDSITWSGGTYSNASSVTSILLYSTSENNLQAPGGNTSTATRTANPYPLSTVDGQDPAYYFAVRDTVVGTNGTTYYYYSNRILSAQALAIAFSYNPGVSATGGWSATISGTSQAGSTYSITSGTGSINASTGQVTVTGLGSNVTTSVTVTKAVPGYNNTTATASGTSATVSNFTLTYNGNGNTGGSTADTVGNGSVTLRANGFTRTNCTFQGWSTSSTGGVTNAPGTSFNLTSNTTLWAVWAANANSATAPTGFKFDGNNLPTSGRKRWSWTGVGTVTGGTATGIRVQMSSTSSTSGFTTQTTLATSARSWDVAVSPVTSPRWVRVAMVYNDGLGNSQVGTNSAAL